MLMEPLITIFRAVLAIFILSLSPLSYADSKHITAKFSPKTEKVLVFVGQDNASVGGTEKWNQGYYDTVGIPAGVTHYVYFTEGKKNRFGYSFNKGSVDGLNKETTWGAGPMCMRCYLESAAFKGSIVHLSISMEFNDEEDVAQGKYDNNIAELARFINEFPDVPFLIRIGYEFDGPWNHYEPEPFKKAWIRIVDTLRKSKAKNFATVMASIGLGTSKATWERYWPGDDYVDWLGYSYWSGGDQPSSTLEFAREKKRPVFIAEATPRGFFIDQLTGMVWHDWYQHFFAHVEANTDVIRAISYINANWDSQPMWKGNGWGNSALQSNPAIKAQWLEKMNEDTYIHGITDGVETTYELIGFK